MYSNWLSESVYSKIVLSELNHKIIAQFLLKLFTKSPVSFKIKAGVSPSVILNLNHFWIDFLSEILIMPNHFGPHYSSNRVPTVNKNLSNKIIFTVIALKLWKWDGRIWEEKDNQYFPTCFSFVFYKFLSWLV